MKKKIGTVLDEGVMRMAKRMAAFHRFMAKPIQLKPHHLRMVLEADAWDS